MSNYSEKECALIIELAALANQGVFVVNDTTEIRQKLKLEQNEFGNIVRALDNLEFFENVAPVPFYGSGFCLSSKCIQEAREIERRKAEPAKRPDLVEETIALMKSNRWVARLIIAFLVLTAFMAFWNQSTGQPFFKSIGLLK